MSNRTTRFAFQTYGVHWTRTYSRAIKLHLRGLNEKSWLFLGLKRLESDCRLTEHRDSDIAAMLKVLEASWRILRARAVMQAEASSVTPPELNLLFRLFEDAIAISSNRLSTRQRCSAATRKFSLETLTALVPNQPLSRFNVKFRSRFTNRIIRPRALISDRAHGGEPPIDAIPHQDIADLHARTAQRVRDDLHAITDACIRELKFWNETRLYLRTLLSVSITQSEYEVALTAVKGGFNDSPRIRMFREFPAAKQLALIQQVVSQTGFARRAVAQSDNPPLRDICNAPEIVRQLLHGDVPDIPAFGQVFCLPYRMLSQELICVLVLLISYTNWNSGAVLQMTSTGIRRERGLLIIQGYKSKTDDYTPEVVVDASMPYAEEAIRLIQWNREQLIALGWLPPDEQRLWFAWGRAPRGQPYTEQYINFQSGLRSFIRRHNLPTFSLEQLRTQRLAHIYLASTTLEPVRRVAGHSSISTTGHYLDQLLLRRLNQSISLEFQRRLESTVVFRLQERVPSTRAPLVLSKVRPRLLLTPVGDGSSCFDPSTPPDSSFLDGELCRAQHCHAGTGCEHRRIVLDESRIEELVRKRHYYLSNWPRLAANHPDHFREVHAPRVLFVLGLYDYVAAGAYRRTLTEIERRLQLQEGQTR